jgi:hypothetical protein
MAPRAMGRRVVEAMLKPVDIQIGPIHIKGRAVVVMPTIFVILGFVAFIVIQVIKNPAIIGQIADLIK